MKELSPLKNKFLDLLLESGALKFGEFKTKSGRMSPFFLNTGAFDHGTLLSSIAQCYAQFMHEQLPPPNGKSRHLYGPAYKGITLASATAVELAKISGREVSFTFNRKEAKDHGEGGQFVGRALSKDSPLIIVEDVMTGGTSIRETMSLLQPLNIPVSAVVIGVDRQERGAGSDLASVEVQKKYDLPVFAILTLDEIVHALWSPGDPLKRLGKIWIDDALKQKIDSYREEWGMVRV